MHNHRTRPLISIVIPIHRDADNVAPMIAELDRAFATLNAGHMRGFDHEIIYVNDNAPDESWERVAEHAEIHPHVRGMCFSRNFGQQSAIMAGLGAAKGDAVVTMDSDLEDPPSFVPELISHWEQGSAVVGTKRRYQKARPLSKRFFSNGFFYIFNAVSDIKLEIGQTDFRLLDRSVVDALIAMPEYDLFHRGLVEWLGFSRVVIPYEKGERTNGQSAYNYRRMFRLAWSGLSSFGLLPLWVVPVIGACVTIASAAALVALAIAQAFFSADVSLLAYGLAAVFLGNGVVVLSIGIMAMYFTRLYREVLRRPRYVIWKKINC